MRRRSLYGRYLDHLRAGGKDIIHRTPEEPRVTVKVVHEDCPHCGVSSQYAHPAGVIPGRWRCYRCGKWSGDVAEVAV